MFPPLYPLHTPHLHQGTDGKIGPTKAPFWRKAPLPKKHYHLILPLQFVIKNLSRKAARLKQCAPVALYKHAKNWADP